MSVVLVNSASTFIFISFTLPRRFSCSLSNALLHQTRCLDRGHDLLP
jgi:hypothetical protein